MFSLGDKTGKRYDLFCAWKSQGSNPTLIFSLSLFCPFFLNILFLLLLRDNEHCWWKSWSVITISVIDHSHIWDKDIPFDGCRRFFSISACWSHPRIKLLSQTVHHCYMSRLMTNPTKWHVRSAKTHISLDIRPVWSESSLSAWRKRGSFASSYPLNAHRRLWSDLADAQTDLSLGWAHSVFVGFIMRRLIKLQYRISVMTSSGVVKWTCFSVIINECRRQVVQKWFLIKNCVKIDLKKAITFLVLL